MNVIGQVEGFWIPCQSLIIAVPAAAALQDPHEVAGEGVTLWAEEAQTDSAGQRGNTAAAVYAGATGPWSVLANGGAPSECDRSRLVWPCHPLTLLSFLRRRKGNSNSNTMIVYFIRNLFVPICKSYVYR